jgi:predicted PurR-regulated permease PerM
MIGVLGVFMAVAIFIVAKPTIDTMKQDEEDRK